MPPEEYEEWYAHYLSGSKMWSVAGYLVMLVLFLLVDEHISGLQWAVDITELVKLYRVSFFLLGMGGTAVLLHFMFTTPEF